ncbi:kelch-like protein 10 [Halichoeres trimaculatus]|uniref:kelch-like protein 10 n=1 Tax=Halichoeres trimaculatus TaxID=147232 RepID=UPI003D9DBF52
MSENTMSGPAVYDELRVAVELCDAVIRVGGAEFPVHKVILCNCSSYFRSLFTHWSSPDRRLFDIPHVSADMMAQIVGFAYTGCVEVSEEKLPELFIAADQFGVRGIIQICSEHLEKQLSPHTCISVWAFSDFYYTPELKHKALSFLLQHFEEVAASSEDFLHLPAGDVAQLLEDDHLNVRKEEAVFEAAVRWINHAPEERRRHSSQLLSRVRLALMSPRYILERVVKDEVVKASEDRLPILLRATDASLHRPRLPASSMLAVGGWSMGRTMSRVSAYDPRAERWVDLSDDGEHTFAYHGTAFLGGWLYCVGGSEGDLHLNAVHRFDLSTRTWQEVAPMHMSRCFVSVAVLDGMIYAVGGRSGSLRLDTAERYEPGTNQWTEISPMHFERSDASCTALHGKVYICGGFTGREHLSSAEYYNPQTDQWTLMPPMGTRRGGLGVVSYAGRIFAVGGFNGTRRQQTAEVYDPHTNTWHAVPSMMNPRSNFGIEVMDDHIYVAGGFNGATTIWDVERFDLGRGEWSDAPDMKIRCSALSCCVVSGLPNMAELAAPRRPLPASEEVQEVEGN